MNALIKSVSEAKVLVILGILFIGFNLLIPFFLPKDQALDLRFAYSVEEATFLMNQLTVDQISDYKFGLMALDMPYLIAYSLLFAGILFKLWGSSFLIYVPFFAGLADFIENLAVFQVLDGLPKASESWIIFASVSTTAKWIFVAILITGVLGGVFRKLLSKKSVITDSQEIKI
ncbi:hypothetical protein [Algoriphagus mannitolivorans]|uniref:hypothetical protein n=1 Tax=Algoriphagus mannitolivorans TaxID=226504 RepID=UPI000427A0DF|nr:hypothetical protein [Algoriphagus mannitolivorans]